MCRRKRHFQVHSDHKPKFNYVVTQGQDSGGKDDNQNPSNPKDNENGTNPGDKPSGDKPSRNTSSEKSSSEDTISRTGANASSPVNVTGGPSTTRSDGKSPAAGSWAKDGKGWKFNYTSDRTSAWVGNMLPGMEFPVGIILTKKAIC
uniref:hypothetical protein n=1 Tax=Clostridium sp. NkU-1 TaxID=1095009 RepID=UPI0006D21368